MKENKTLQCLDLGDLVPLLHLRLASLAMK